MKMSTIFYIILSFFTLFLSTHSFSSSFHQNRRISSHLSITKLHNNNNRNNDLRIDESKLSQSERDRLAFIKKLSLEADDMIRQAGLSQLVDNDDGEEIDTEEVQRSIRETKWSGQSDAELTMASSSNYDDLTNRWGLALGDALALVTFAAVGRSNHGEGIDITGLLSTSAPFVLSWLAISPFLGSYSRAATSSKSGVAIGILPGWGVCIPLALALRGFLKGTIPPTPFIIVSLVSTFVFLCIWRFVYISFTGETSDGEYKQAGYFEVFKMIGTLLKRW